MNLKKPMESNDNNFDQNVSISNIMNRIMINTTPFIMNNSNKDQAIEMNLIKSYDIFSEMLQVYCSFAPYGHSRLS